MGISFVAYYPWYCEKCGASGDCESTEEVPLGTACPECGEIDCVILGVSKKKVTNKPI